jgi:hypothetical protein
VVGGETEDGGEAVEKAMLEMVSLEKSDQIAPEVKERARAALRELSVPYLSKQASGAYAEPAARAAIEKVRKAEQGGLAA